MALKNHFTHEASDFTPWLSKYGLQIIKDITGDDNVELFKRECTIGNYRLDLLYKTSNKKPLIVENQFGNADSKHLGQVILYSALLNTKDVIWIADSFNPEHYKILNYLNLNLYLVTFSFSYYSQKLILKLYVKNKFKTFQIIYKCSEDLTHLIKLKEN